MGDITLGFLHGLAPALVDHGDVDAVDFLKGFPLDVESNGRRDGGLELRQVALAQPQSVAVPQQEAGEEPDTSSSEVA